MIILVLILIGLALGSFVNALVWRLHEQETPSKRRKRSYSILKGRSMCPHCHHVLASRDLMPVISWLLLRGKCRYCKLPIHWQYPVIELLTAALLVASYAVWPYSWQGEGLLRFILWIPILVTLITLLIYDVRWMLLPDRLTIIFTLLVITQLAGIAVFHGGDFNTVTGAILGVLPLGGFFYLLFQISDGRWIGGGDVKLGFGLGLLAGSMTRALLLLFLSSAIGSLVSIALISANRASRKTQLPFGPFLILAAVITQLFGDPILTWYENHFMIF